MIFVFSSASCCIKELSLDDSMFQFFLLITFMQIKFLLQIGRNGRIWSGFGCYQLDIADSLIDVAATRNLNSSPDLGIESDQGRFSSLEAGMPQSFPVMQLEKSSYTNHDNMTALVLSTSKYF